MIMQFFLGGGEGWVNRFIMEFLQVDNYADQAEFFFIKSCVMENFFTNHKIT